MDDLTTKVGIPGLSGLAGIVLGWFGLRTRIIKVEERMDKLSDNVVFTDVFQTFEEGLKIRLSSHEKLLKESRDDLKEVLGRLPLK